jgi:hypothetical protein
MGSRSKALIERRQGIYLKVAATTDTFGHFDFAGVHWHFDANLQILES